MKKIILPMIALLCAATIPIGTQTKRAGAEETLANSKAAYLCDFESGTVIHEQNATMELPIASMCKIMTLLLSFEAVDEGNLSYDEQITVSETASGMGGSQVFLQTGLSYPAEQLMKSIAVCSANDSCVAMAERISGSESSFVEKMNERARELGADHTLFANCTGLPKEPQYSCAKDVSLMLRELIRHQKYFEFSKVWLEDFAHPDGRTTTITNTNKLIRFYEGCDGGKTGFTNQAGFCLAATAKRGDMRLVSVVIGAENSQARFDGIKNMFNYAFANYENFIVAEAGKPIDTKLTVGGSKQKEIFVCPETSLTIFRKRGQSQEYSTQFILKENCKAPLMEGATVGEAVLYQNGVEMQRCNLIAMESALKYTYREAFQESARHWN